MKKILYCLFMISQLFYQGYTQTLVPKKCYMHLEGAINKELLLSIDLVKIDDSLYCDYYIDKSAFEQNNCPSEVGEIQSICGRMIDKDSFFLKSLFNDEGPSFKGHFTPEQHIAGTWKCGQNGEEFHFEVTEKYPEGSVPLNLFYIKDAKLLTTKTDAPSATIQLAMLMPAESSNALVSDSLSKIVIRTFSDKLCKDTTPERILSSMKQRFFDHYLNSNESLAESMPDGASLNWELLKFMHVLCNKNNILSFYFLSYAFTGGAHGLETQEFCVVDLKSGKVLQLQDLFRDLFEQPLSLLLTKKLHKMANLQENQKLTEAGYFVDEIKPTENFYKTGSGIGFFYNHYDIAPYSFGSTDIFLTFEELKDILK